MDEGVAGGAALLPAHPGARLVAACQAAEGVLPEAALLRDARQTVVPAAQSNEEVAEAQAEVWLALSALPERWGVAQLVPRGRPWVPGLRVSRPEVQALAPLL